MGGGIGPVMEREREREQESAYFVPWSHVMDMGSYYTVVSVVNK